MSEEPFITFSECSECEGEGFKGEPGSPSNQDVDTSYLCPCCSGAKRLPKEFTFIGAGYCQKCGQYRILADTHTCYACWQKARQKKKADIREAVLALTPLTFRAIHKPWTFTQITLRWKGCSYHGYGFAKYRPDDADKNLPYNEGFGVKIADGKARAHLIEQILAAEEASCTSK